MIDKLMSRRCLIEAAAGALLLSGCSSQDESSTKKVKKQDKIKKAEASDQSKHLRDKDELYEVYDDSGIVTMYLTVSRGNSSENTDHSWAEINTYSVYDYADMGVTRYQVMGLLQPGDEDGPVAGEVGYGEPAPRLPVHCRWCQAHTLHNIVQILLTNCLWSKLASRETLLAQCQHVILMIHIVQFYDVSILAYDHKGKNKS